MIPVKSVPVFFDIFGRGHVEELYELLAEVPHIIDPHLEGCLPDVHVLGTPNRNG